MALFSVTYERWNEAALDAGETDDKGFVLTDVSLADAIQDGLEGGRGKWLGHCEPDDSSLRLMRSLTFPNWNDCTAENLRTGIMEDRCLHIPHYVTPASRRRIARLLGVRSA
jgi:hypothetical protein